MDRAVVSEPGFFEIYYKRFPLSHFTLVHQLDALLRVGVCFWDPETLRGLTLLRGLQDSRGCLQVWR